MSWAGYCFGCGKPIGPLLTKFYGIKNPPSGWRCSKCKNTFCKDCTRKVGLISKKHYCPDCKIELQKW